MYLSTSKNVDEIRRHIIKFREQSEEKLKLFNLFQAQLKQIIDVHNNHRQILYVLDLGIRQAKLYLDWSETILKDMEKGKLDSVK